MHNHRNARHPLSHTVTCKKCGTHGLLWRQSKAGRWYLVYQNGEPHWEACKRLVETREYNRRYEAWRAEIEEQIRDRIRAGDDAGALAIIENAKFPG